MVTPEISVNRIVEFFSNRNLRLGLVTGEMQGKYRILNKNGKTERVASNRIFVVHEQTSTQAEFRNLARQLREEIDLQMQDVDVEFLWESLSGQEGPFTLAQLAEEYFGDPTPCQSSAIFRKILQSPFLFKLRAFEVFPRSSEEAAQLLDEERRTREREEFQAKATHWLESVLESEEDSQPLEIPEEMEPVVAGLESVLRGSGGSRTVRALIKRFRPQLSPREASFELLETLDRLPRDGDRFLLLAGIEAQFSSASLQLAGTLEPFGGDSWRESFEELESFSVDDAETRDVDDALTLEIIGSGLRVGIHIADVSHFVQRGDALFEQAMRRPSSIYLPHLRIPMLPGRLSSDLCSLVQGELRPAVSFLIDFDEDLKLKHWRIVSSQLRVHHRLTYDEVDELIRSQGDSGLGLALARLDSLAQSLAEQRGESGALNLKQPELKVIVDAGEVKVEVLPADSAARGIVSELMILANQIAAQYAFLRDVPVIYRVQDPPRQPIQVPTEYDPVAYGKIFRQLEKGRFSLARQPHFGLGLPGYTQLTSPIRRLGDLVIQQQVSAQLAGRPLPFEQSELLEILTQAELGEKEVRSAERQANRFYILQFLEESLSSGSTPGVVLDKLYNGYLVELCDFFIRGRLVCPTHLEPGDRVTLAIERINPKKNVLVFGLA